MAKLVGFSCALKLPWLNKAAQLVEEKLTVEDYKKELSEYLSFEISGTELLRKTRDILMNVWYYENTDIGSGRDTAIQLLKEYPEYSSAIQLCMLYLTFPVFKDICSYAGRILDFQDDFTNQQLSKKLYDDWGERGTLSVTCQRVTLTLTEMGLLTSITKQRHMPTKQVINAPDVIGFIIWTAMKTDKNSYYSLEELTAFDCMYPLSYPISKELLMTDKRFSVSTFAGDMAVSLSSNNI